MTQAVKRLVACFDGTWNTERSNTNVSRMFKAIGDETNGCPDQRRFYDEGVGTSFGERIKGGVLGIGLDRNIRQGYAWLATHFPAPGASARDPQGFAAGPDIYLFGFSRGAFTARSLGGLINYLGLPRLETVPAPDPDAAPEDHPLVARAWSLYKARPTPAEREKIARGTADARLRRKVDEHDRAADDFRIARAAYPVRIHYLGVWDTVGALGIPRVLDYPWIPRFSTKYLFHDTRLGRCVRHAYHAMAIDEHREPYATTLWTGRERTTEEVEQRWFPGAHSNVGGGYANDRLPAPPLAWLAEKAAQKGLQFVNDRAIEDPATAQVLPAIDRPPAAFDLDGREHLAPVRDSYAEFLLGTYAVLRSLPGARGRVYRRMLVETDGIAQRVDITAFSKLAADPEYRPPNLAEAGRLDVSFAVPRLEVG